MIAVVVVVLLSSCEKNGKFWSKLKRAKIKQKELVLDTQKKNGR